ncbi:MAG: ornithine carbamoyltransferase [Phycisphaerales bacterium]|nr:MAG: ornithine carbamoyltransferase [Phycisphaerales bacterium]
MTTTVHEVVDVKTAQADKLPADLLGVGDFSPAQIAKVMDLAASVKANPGAYSGKLAGKSAVLIFEKPSLRTRMSFEIGLAKLGATVVFHDHSAQRIGQREIVKDYAKNLERWVDLIVARTFSHDVLAEMAAWSRVPVVNALSDLEHPCQALADLFTLREAYGSLEGLKLAYVGDGNNVAHSLVLACASLGVDVTVVTPTGFEPQFAVLKQAAAIAKGTGSKVTVSRDPKAIRGHHAVYTDTWVSMGQDHQRAQRESVMGAYRVSEKLMALASEGLDEAAVFMHCLPAHRGEEVTAGVIDGDRSLIYDQAENRLHVQNAVMLMLFGMD